MWGDYLFINYHTITNYILIIYMLSNLDHVLRVVSQNRISDGNLISTLPTQNVKIKVCSKNNCYFQFFPKVFIYLSITL